MGQWIKIEADDVIAHVRKCFGHLDNGLPTPGALAAEGETGVLHEFEHQLADASTALRMRLTQITQVIEANAVALRTAAQELSEHDQTVKDEMGRLTAFVDESVTATAAAAQEAQTSAAMSNDAVAYAQAIAPAGTPPPVTPTPTPVPPPPVLAAQQPPVPPSSPSVGKGY